MIKKDVQKEIIIHAVFEDHDDRLDFHTHGLDKYDHPEFQVIAPSLFSHSAGRLLNSLADAVINKGEKFRDGESCNWEEWGDFFLEERESPDEVVLTIVSIVPECECCRETELKNLDDMWRK